MVRQGKLSTERKRFISNLLEHYNPRDAKDVRKVIYTTNSNENYNRQLRKATKTRTIFPTDDALFKLHYLAVIDIAIYGLEKTWNWRQTSD